MTKFENAMLNHAICQTIALERIADALAGDEIRQRIELLTAALGDIEDAMPSRRDCFALAFVAGGNNIDNAVVNADHAIAALDAEKVMK